MRMHERSTPSRRPRTGASRARSCAIALLVLLAGCAHEQVIVRSECPEPNPVEAQDLSDWLLEEPERPAQVWAARVVGHIYPEDLDALRGGDAGAEEPSSWGWMMPPWWGDEKEIRR